MKKLILSLIVTTTCSLNALAADSMGNYIRSAQQIREIYRDLNLGGLQRQIRSSILENRQEVVTQVYESEYAASSGSELNHIFYSYRGNRDSQSRSYVDVTRILTTNAEAVQNQSQQAGSEFAQLRSDILRLMESKSADLIRMKEQGLINVISAYELIKTGRNVPISELRDTAQLLGALQFAGQQTVSRCVKTDYADRRLEFSGYRNSNVNERTYYWSYDANSTSSYHDYWRQISHSETTCRSTTNSVSVGQNETVYSVNFSVLDRSIADWFKALDLLIATRPEQLISPDWGSPYSK